LSEEDTIPDYAYRIKKDYVWLLDPLDGTAEFVNRNGEFTINLALIFKGEPIAGFVYIPVLDKYFYAFKGHGAFKFEGDVEKQIYTNKNLDPNSIKIAISRSHDDENKIKSKLNNFEIGHQLEFNKIGSTLKIVLVAEGIIDLYPRFGPTWEWDTAAGDIILYEAGGIILDLNKQKLSYNKENLKNPDFICFANNQLVDIFYNKKYSIKK
jgi:3'(2'), 5'-bisphosphate nucleotidase